MELRGFEPRLAALGQVRNSRIAVLPLAMLFCSPRFRFAFVCGEQPTGLALSSAPLQCFALFQYGVLNTLIRYQKQEPPEGDSFF